MLSELTACILWIAMIFGFTSVWLESRKDEVLEPVERTQAFDRSNVVVISSHPGHSNLQPYDWEIDGL